MQMRLSACVTTRNRTVELDVCLRALWNSTVKPHSVVVSDDSPDIEVQRKNRQIVQLYPRTNYITGPQAGVCANRNCALRETLQFETDLIAFVDDDIYFEPDFIELAAERYAQMTCQERNRTILSGITRDCTREIASTKLSFRGYFCSTDVPEAVAIHAAVFPRSFLDQEQWDENIFFGYEDAELSLRALKRGYQILHTPELKVFNACSSNGTLGASAIKTLTNYEIHIESARLYVGIKRYKDLFPNTLKLLLFVIIYFLHMTIYLLRRRSLRVFPEIIRRSRIQRLWQPSEFLETG